MMSCPVNRIIRYDQFRHFAALCAIAIDSAIGQYFALGKLLISQPKV